VRAAITHLIASTVIVALGAAAVTVYAIRLRHREKFLLWFGLFSILYGVVLIVRNSVFRLGFGEPQNFRSLCRAADRLVDNRSRSPAF
jgi:hypothetical protein